MSILLFHATNQRPLSQCDLQYVALFTDLHSRSCLRQLVHCFPFSVILEQIHQASWLRWAKPFSSILIKLTITSVAIGLPTPPTNSTLAEPQKAAPGVRQSRASSTAPPGLGQASMAFAVLTSQQLRGYRGSQTPCSNSPQPGPASSKATETEVSPTERREEANNTNHKEREALSPPAKRHKTVDTSVLNATSAGLNAMADGAGSNGSGGQEQNQVTIPNCPNGVPANSFVQQNQTSGSSHGDAVEICLNLKYK